MATASPREIFRPSIISSLPDSLSVIPAVCPWVRPWVTPNYSFVSVPSAFTSTSCFFHAEVMNLDFSELHEGDKVRYKHGRNERGICAVDIEVLMESAVPASTQ